MNCCTPDSITQSTVCATEPASATVPQLDATRSCPRCGQAGRAVTRETMRHLLKPEWINRMEERSYRFCVNPDCPVVYFAEKVDNVFTTDDLRVCVGLKEHTDPIPICYCFGHMVASARDEIARTGRSTVLASITAEIKAGRCACEITNPSGNCCIGEVRKIIKELMKDRAAFFNPSVSPSDVNRIRWR